MNNQSRERHCLELVFLWTIVSCIKKLSHVGLIFLFNRSFNLELCTTTNNTKTRTLHYGIRADILEKSYQKMFNFENWFLCQF